jgi:hypothetical protein
MALYLGDSGKVKVTLGDSITYSLIMVASLSENDDYVLMSSDNYFIKDSNGFFLSPVTIDNEEKD